MLSPTRFAFSSNTFRLVFFHYKLTATQNLPLNYSRACRHKKNIVLLSRLGVVFECCTFLQLIENYISLFKGSVNKWLGKKTLRNKPGIPISNNFYFKYAISTYVHLQQNFWCSQPISSFKRKRNKDQKAGHYQNLRIWQWAKMKICRYSFTNLNESSQNWDADQYKVTEVAPPLFFFSPEDPFVATIFIPQDMACLLLTCNCSTTHVWGNFWASINTTIISFIYWGTYMENNFL